MQEVLAGVGSIYQGQVAKAQYQTEAAMAQRQAEDVDLQAKQASGQQRDALRAAMSAIQARRAASGVGLDSPSAQAIEKQVQHQSVIDENINRVGFGNQITALNTGAAWKKRAGKYAAIAGYISGGEHFLKAGSEVAQAAMGGGGGGGGGG